MKTVETVKEIIVTKYIAEDGAEFSSREACLNYESLKGKEKLSMIEQCKEAEGCSNFDGWEHMECYDYFWFRPMSKKDVDILNKAFSQDSSNEITYDIIGEWICIECGSYDFSWSKLSDGISYVTDLLDGATCS